MIEVKFIPGDTDLLIESGSHSEGLMRGVLVALQSIREHEKRRAWRDLVDAERARDEQEARLESLQDEVSSAREAGDEGESAMWLAQRQSWCLQMEMRRRYEARRLLERVETAEERRGMLETARQKARTVELVIEQVQLEEDIEGRRVEARQNDEIASQRWWRRCG